MQYRVSKGTGGEGTHSSFAEQPVADCQSGAQATACIPQLHEGTIVEAFGRHVAPLPAEPETVSSAPEPHVLVSDCVPVQPPPTPMVTPPLLVPHGDAHPPVAN
jgi:hypothetical protein